MIQEKIKLGVISLGCPKNTADTEALLGELNPFFVLSQIEEAEIILLNTCAFLKIARDEVFANIKKYSDKKIIVVGCITGTFQQDIFNKYPQIYAVVSSKNYQNILKIALAVNNNQKIFAAEKEESEYLDLRNKNLITPLSYAYVKIAEGCNNHCSFCLIPKLKGQYRSRKMSSIIQEVKRLLDMGVKEIILVAQDCGYYGRDLAGKKSLTLLLKKIIALKGDFWVRILYVYPERITDELLDLMANSEKICKYFDIPLQHGDSEILKKMQRPHFVERTLSLIDKIRKKIPEATLRTSIIVGFPGEGEKEFLNLFNFVEKIDFDHLGVFEYSREKETLAYALPKQVSPKIKKARHEKIMLLQQKISEKRNGKMVGKKLMTLIENYDNEKNLYYGRSTRFSPEIDGQIIIDKAPKNLPLNTFCQVRIKKALPYDLIGEVE